MGKFENRVQELKQNIKPQFIGARVQLEGVTVDCNIHRTFEENAIVAYRGLKAVFGDQYSQSFADEYLEVDAFSSSGSVFGQEPPRGQGKSSTVTWKPSE